MRAGNVLVGSLLIWTAQYFSLLPSWSSMNSFTSSGLPLFLLQMRAWGLLCLHEPNASCRSGWSVYVNDAFDKQVSQAGPQMRGHLARSACEAAGPRRKPRLGGEAAHRFPRAKTSAPVSVFFSLFCHGSIDLSPSTLTSVARLTCAY
jgi:hypothetical protein